MPGASHATSAAPPNPADLRTLLQLINGYRVSQAIYVAIELQIADQLKDRSDTVGNLAKATGANDGALYRLLRFLAGAGVFEEKVPDASL